MATKTWQNLKEDTKNLSQLSLQCYPIQLGIHTDPSIGAHTYSCLRYSSKQVISAAVVVAGIVS